MSESNQVTTIYNGLVEIAKSSKSGKLNQNEVMEKYLKFQPSATSSKVMVKLNDDGYIVRTSDTPPLLVDFKRQWDDHGLEDLQKNGEFTYKPSDPSHLDSIVNDPNPSSSRLFVETCYKNVDGGYDIFNPTINNSNETNRRLRIEQNGKLTK